MVINACVRRYAYIKLAVLILYRAVFLYIKRYFVGAAGNKFISASHIKRTGIKIILAVQAVIFIGVSVICSFY